MWLLGLDVGQRQDPACALLAERVGQGYAAEYRVRWGMRWPLHTEYGAVADAVEHVMTSPVFGGAAPTLIVDATGVGAPVVEMLRRRKLMPRAVQFTSGKTVTEGEGGMLRVPKADLVASLALVMEQGRLKISKKLEIAPQIEHELKKFRMRRTKSGGQSYDAMKESDHDDLVDALCLICWWGERKLRFGHVETRRDRLTYTAALMQPVGG